MSEDAEVKPKKSKKPLLLGVVLAILLGAGGFFAAKMGMIPGLGGHAAEGEHASESDGHGTEEAKPLDAAFVPVEPLTISLVGSSKFRYLKFAAQIEVGTAEVENVTTLMPRIVDAMNSYLRAVDPKQFESPGALLKLRGQLLRRINLVLGEHQARNLLVMEFVLN